MGLTGLGDRLAVGNQGEGGVKDNSQSLDLVTEWRGEYTLLRRENILSTWHLFIFQREIPFSSNTRSAPFLAWQFTPILEVEYSHLGRCQNRSMEAQMA